MSAATEPSDALPLYRHATTATLVGLAPLLALAPDAASAFAFATAIMLMTAMTSPTFLLLRRATPTNLRRPVFVLLLAAAAGATHLLLAAGGHGLHALTAFGVPMVTANLALWSNIGRDAPASGLRRATVAAMALLLLGALRELFARGTLLATAGALFGARFDAWTLQPFAGDHGLLLFARPAGALFALALLLAGVQAWRARRGRAGAHA